jgi:hypothetical protein
MYHNVLIEIVLKDLILKIYKFKQAFPHARISDQEIPGSNPGQD